MVTKERLFPNRRIQLGWGTHASRVLVLASRQNNLFLQRGALLRHRLEKSMPARRRHQRARRARSLGRRRRFQIAAPCPGVVGVRDLAVSADSANEILAYWLIPAEPALSYFRSTINALAARFDASVFEPHVTLYVTNAAKENPAEVLTHAVANSKTYRLSIAGIDSSDEFTKTLFVQFQPDVALARLNESLRSVSVSQREYRLNPHLSLIYKKMLPETKAQIANSLSLPFGEVEFDAVKAVISPAKIESRADVEAWRVLAAKGLTG